MTEFFSRLRPAKFRECSRHEKAGCPYRRQKPLRPKPRAAGASTPDPRWGLPLPDTPLNGVWGGAPTGSGAEPQRGSGAGAPIYILSAKPPWGLGQSPRYMLAEGEPPATFLRQSRPGVWGGSGGGAPSYILAAKPPRGLGRSPKTKKTSNPRFFREGGGL